RRADEQPQRSAHAGPVRQPSGQIEHGGGGHRRGSPRGPPAAQDAETHGGRRGGGPGEPDGRGPRPRPPRGGAGVGARGGAGGRWAIDEVPVCRGSPEAAIRSADEAESDGRMAVRSIGAGSIEATSPGRVGAGRAPTTSRGPTGSRSSRAIVGAIRHAGSSAV